MIGAGCGIPIAINVNALDNLFNMTALEQQIVTDYEVNGTSPTIIAQDNSLELPAVQATLIRYSSKYKEAIEQHREDDITQSDYERIKETLKQLALYSESDAVRAKVGIFLFNERKGRNNSKSNVIKNTQFNILTLNEGIKQARQALMEGNIENLKQIEAKILGEEKTT